LWVIAVVAALGLATVGAVGFASTRDNGGSGGLAPALAPKAGTVTMKYSITVYADSDIGYQGYSDIEQGADVEVFDGHQVLLGTGQLGYPASYTGYRTFTATFPVKKSSDGFYRVTSGNNNRGFLNYDSADVVDGVLKVNATLGS
jgi:hypothetical protein